MCKHMPVILALLKLTYEYWNFVDYIVSHVLKTKYQKYEKQVSSWLLFPDRLQKQEWGIPDYDLCIQVTTCVSHLTSYFPNQYEETKTNYYPY